jgi:hypothetical protein
MDEVEFDQIIARAGNPNLIPGIYNYCDRRCERCPFTERCFQYLETRREHSQDGPRLGEESVGQAVARSLERSLDMLRIIGRRLGIDLSGQSAAPGADVDGKQFPDLREMLQDEEQEEEQEEQEEQEEEEEEEEDQDEQDVAIEEDPLVLLARKYANTTWPILRALRPVLHIRGDAALVDALETLELYGSSISAKVFRAVSSAAEVDFDASDLQNDANGSAKIARLMVRESRRAWRELMEPGQATEDGVPARLVRMLGELDAAISTRFPRAMDFLRPGFDTERSDTRLGVCSPGCRRTPSSTDEKPAAMLERSSS